MTSIMNLRNPITVTVTFFFSINFSSWPEVCFPQIKTNMKFVQKHEKCNGLIRLEKDGFGGYEWEEGEE